MKTFVSVFQSFLPVFLGSIAGLYLFQALNYQFVQRPHEIFSRRECWAIGLIAVLAAFAFSLNNRYQWFH